MPLQSVSNTNNRSQENSKPTNRQTLGISLADSGPSSKTIRNTTNAFWKQSLLKSLVLGTQQTNYGVNEKGWISVRVIRDSQLKKGHQNYVDGKYLYHKLMSGYTSNWSGHPATGRGGPRGSGLVKALEFLDIRHYKGGRSSVICTDRLYPRRNPWYSFSGAESTQGHMVLPGENSQWHHQESILGTSD
jgi:hypothetical protein